MAMGRRIAALIPALGREAQRHCRRKQAKSGRSFRWERFVQRAERAPRCICVATDFSEGAERALSRALSLCNQHASALLLVHALEAPDWLSRLLGREHPAVDALAWRGAAQCALDRLAEQARARGVHAVDTRLLEGPLHVGLKALVDSEVDLLVVGAAGASEVHGGWGSRVDRCLRTWPKPLLLVRSLRDGRWQRVLCATDFSACALRAARCALALSPQALHLLLHVHVPPFDMPLDFPGVDTATLEGERYRAAAQALRALESLAAELSIGQARALVPVLREGRPAAAILELLEDTPCELLVLGAHGRSAVERSLIGSVSQRAAQGAACDVLLVPMSSPATDGVAV
jgi:universal stress protein E